MATRILPTKIMPIFNKKGEMKKINIQHGRCWSCDKKTYVFEITPYCDNDDYVDICLDCIKKTKKNMMAD